ncbi:MAG: iron ABC transporter permease [Planctomycetes bacterium]|nr:iron ABC transporter permease [Planctomycetota bacterium]
MSRLAAKEPTLRGLILTALVPAAVLAAVVAACSLVGQMGAAMPWDDPDLWRLRLLRVVTAAVVGAGLAVAGAALQSLLRNGLADPYVLGISSGAGVGVLAAMALTASGTAAWLGLPAMAAAGAIVTVGAVYLIAQRRGRLDPFSLLLTGVIVNAFNGAVMLLIYLRNPYVIADYISWAMGAIPETHPAGLLAAVTVLTAGGWVLLTVYGQAFNVLSLGDDVAASSGVNVHRLRRVTFGVTAALTAASVAVAGPIGFLGLIVPHVCRALVGADHRRLLILSGFAGAILLAGADTFCRCTVLWFGQELPVGVITACCGGPFFLVLLRRRFRERVQ